MDREDRDIRQLLSDLPLRARTPADEWLAHVHASFGLFLADHASNERKAAASAMDFCVRYPNRPSLVKMASRVAMEEIDHFRRVFDLMEARGHKLMPDEKDPYAGHILKNIRHGSEERLLDRLLMASVIELRGVERFCILAMGVEDPELRAFYTELAWAEKGHWRQFFLEGKSHFEMPVLEERYDAFLDLEAEAFAQTPLTHRFH